ncbi:MAG TPA: EAL domain-containing protein [Gammaproteobacteria bacterium]
MNDKVTAKLVFIGDGKEGCKTFVDMLADTGFPVDCHVLENLDTLPALQTNKRLDLLIYLHQRNAADEKRLVQILKKMDDPPALILVADRLTPQDYIHASRLGACDVVNTELPAQFTFVVRREFAGLEARRRLNEAVRHMRENQIMDETGLEPPAEAAGGMGEMVEVIDDALKNNKLELLFQPIMSVEDDGHDNFEIFLRIKQGDDFIMPDAFLPTAEQFGLMPAIDRWVVKNAIRRFKAEEQVKKIKKQTQRGLRFFLNISGHSLVDEVIMSNIILEITSAKLSPGNFVIEVDKNTILSRLQKTKSLNQNVKKLKLEFAIDFFEQSDISLNYIKHLELDYLKLSHNVVTDIHKNPEKKEAVREIVKKARENNIKVVATQVENAEVLPALYELGVDYIQGYVIAEPGPRLSAAILDTMIG